MKQFLKYVLATITGFLISIFLFFIIANLIVLGLVSQLKPDDKVSIKPRSVLMLRLDYNIKERTSNDPFEKFQFPSFDFDKSKLGLNDILKNIKRAKYNDDIDGIYLNLTYNFRMGMATMEELRKALIDFKKSGKFIIAYSELYSQKTYYLATAADSIYINPNGLVEFIGMNSQAVFLKNLLDKLEIEPQIFYNGKFKSATEPFRRTDMSDASKKQTREFLGYFWDHFLKEIASVRNTTPAYLDSIADNLLIRTADDAVKYKLADKVMYEEEVLNILKEKTGIKENLPQLVTLGRFNRVPDKNRGSIFRKDKIAVLYADGAIVDGEGGNDEVGSEKYGRSIRELRNDSTIKAVVLRVNSPGGSALASDIIWHELKETQKVKPVVVSMSDMAASGGYYIACIADKVYAHPTTITGSIGVFAIIPNLKGFFNNKLGVTFDGVKTNQFADISTLTRSLTPEEEKIIQSEVDRIYQTFLERVATGRDMPAEVVDSIAQGRVWSGLAAMENNLVDEMGSLDDAIEEAARLAEIEDYRLKEYPEQPDPFEKLLKNLPGNVKAYMLGEEWKEFKRYQQQLDYILKNSGVQARMPFELQIR